MRDDTAPIRPEERFDEQKVAAYLRATIPELAAASELEFAQFFAEPLEFVESREITAYLRLLDSGRPSASLLLGASCEKQNPRAGV